MASTPKSSQLMSPFKAGTIFNDLRPPFRKKAVPVLREIILRYPSRLNAMAIDPGKIDIRHDMRYAPGEVIFSIGIYKQVTVSFRKDNRIVISPSSSRPALILHAALLMRKALGISCGFNIDVEDPNEIRHCGLGSSSGLIAAIASAMNELYGNPIPATDLIRYLAQNHGEEIDRRNDILNPVQCIGGSAAAGLCHGGIIVLAGESIPIAVADVPPDYRVVLGIPRDIPHLDSRVLMEMEKKQLPRFIATGRRFGKKNAYNVLHTMLPAMHAGDISAIGDVIYEYRFRMGSIKNCSFAYPPLPRIAKKLSFLKEKNIAQVLAISSVGPGFFAITTHPRECAAAFRKQNLAVYETTVNNGGYKVLSGTKMRK